MYRRRFNGKRSPVIIDKEMGNGIVRASIIPFWPFGGGTGVSSGNDQEMVFPANQSYKLGGVFMAGEALCKRLVARIIGLMSVTRGMSVYVPMSGMLPSDD